MEYPGNRVSYRIFGGIFFISFAALMFEVSLSRLLSITLWHHFAFLIISCALLGYGSAGSWLLIFKNPVEPFHSVLLFSLTLFPLNILVNRLPFDPTLLPLDFTHWLYIVLIFLLLAVPFFFAGMTLNLLLRKYPSESFRLYSFDLLGAAAGCSVFFVLASRFNETDMLWIIMLIGIISTLLLVQESRQFTLAILLLAIVFGGRMVTELPELHMNPYKTLPKALKYPGSRLLMTKRDAVSRIDWFKSPLARFAPGLSLNYHGQLPEQLGITLDGSQLTAYSDWNDKNTEYLIHLPSRILFHLNPLAKDILVLQTLGGQDVKSAIFSGAERIDVQTENSLLADWLEEQNQLDNVFIRADRIRSYLASTRKRYDRIVVSLEGSLPTGESGMSVLQESSLETVEGLSQLLSHLDNDGWLSIHRYLLPPPRAEFRLLTTLNTAMKQRGWDSPNHLGIFRTISTMMILVSAQKWSEDDKKTFRDFCNSQGHAMVYYPGIQPNEINQENRFNIPVYALAVDHIFSDSVGFLRDNIFDVKPVFDDKPFFYHFLRFKYLPEIYHSFDKKWEALIETGLLLPLIFVMVGVLALVFVVVPLIIIRGTIGLFKPGMMYFFWIGLGFMTVEIVLFEKLMLFLGEPTYSFAIVLSSLLVFSGIGSSVSKLLPEHIRDFGHLGLLTLLLMYAVIFAGILSVFEGYGFFSRLIISVVVTAIPGILMGMPFPRGIFKIGQPEQQEKTDNISLAWCLNSFASVIGSVGAMLLAQISGLSSLFIWSALFYSLAWGAIRRLS